jgi:hypothetical protein
MPQTRAHPSSPCTGQGEFASLPCRNRTVFRLYHQYKRPQTSTRFLQKHDYDIFLRTEAIILLQDDGNSELLQEQFAQNVDKSVVLEVYSSKEQSVRGMDQLYTGGYQCNVAAFLICLLQRLLSFLANLGTLQISQKKLA